MTADDPNDGRLLPPPLTSDQSEIQHLAIVYQKEVHRSRQIILLVLSDDT